LIIHHHGDIFDNDVKPESLAEFLRDPRHHLVIAIADGLVIGMVSGVHYIHPDKSPEMFINEAGVDEGYRGKGIGKKLLHKLIEHGKSLNCTSAWVLTESDNVAANKVYSGVGGIRFAEGLVMYEFESSILETNG